MIFFGKEGGFLKNTIWQIGSQFANQIKKVVLDSVNEESQSRSSRQVVMKDLG